jgi:hypothetical protein
MAGYGYGAQIFTDMFAATRSFYAKKTIEDIERSHPLLDKIAGKGNFEGKEGAVGKRNVELILARINDHARWVRWTDPIEQTTVSLLEQIEWDWKFCYNDFVVNDKTLAINKSDEIASLLELNQKAMRAGFSRMMATQLYSDGSPKSGADQGLEMGGLRYMLSENPYLSSLVVLNLQRGVRAGEDVNKFEFWRNRAGEFLSTGTAANSFTADKAANSAKLIDGMRHMIQTLNTTSAWCDGIYMNYKFYDMYVYYMQEKLHINNVQGEMKDGGLLPDKFMGIQIYLDKYCPNNQIYFLDSSTLHFKYLEGENFKQEVRQIHNKWEHQYITTFIGNFVIERPRHNGVITLNDATNGLPNEYNVCLFDGYKDLDYPVNVSGQSSDSSVERTDYSASGVYRPLYTPPATNDAAVAAMKRAKANANAGSTDFNMKEFNSVKGKIDQLKEDVEKKKK